jgi:hypothetical protein
MEILLLRSRLAGVDIGANKYENIKLQRNEAKVVALDFGPNTQTSREPESS